MKKSELIKKYEDRLYEEARYCEKYDCCFGN